MTNEIDKAVEGNQRWKKDIKNGLRKRTKDYWVCDIK